MKSGSSDSKRIERRARMMMMEKDIPHTKMDIVRSLLKNESLLPEEKYGAVIDLIQNCPDKKNVSEAQDRRKIETRNISSPARQTVPGATAVLPRPRDVSAADAVSDSGPEKSSVFIGLVALKYRETGLFRKKYIIRTSRFPGFSFHKRLVPAKPLFRALKMINDCQRKISSRMPFIMDAILNDPEVEDPTVYNYMRMLNLWMNEIPLLSIRYEKSSNMLSADFSAEFGTYIRYFTMFSDLDIDTKEKIINSAELRLKELTFAGDNIQKQKNNLHEKDDWGSDKTVHDYVMTLRSFLPVRGFNEGGVDIQLQKKFRTETLSDFIKSIAESLIFRREVELTAIKKYFKADHLSVSREKWMCGESDLKLAGKDDESRLIKYRARLKTEVEPLDEMYQFIQMKCGGMSILKKSFDDQWRVINRRRHDYLDEYNDNFSGFLDECLAFFSSVMVPYIDGTQIQFSVQNGKTVSSSIFSADYFASELSRLNDLLNDMASYRSDNPTMKIGRVEMKKILTGQLSTFNDIRQLIKRAGDVFYNLAEELHLHYRLHCLWSESPEQNLSGARIPVSREAVFSSDETGITKFMPEPRPFPFYDCRIAKDDVTLPHIRIFSGKPVLGENASDSVALYLLGFCYQMASECYEERLYNDLVRRKDLKKKITDLIGRIV